LKYKYFNCWYDVWIKGVSKKTIRKMKKVFIVSLAVAILTTNCKNMNKTQKGAVIGTAGGAAVGAVIGKASGNTALGAIIGATVGGVTGAVIGRKMDKQAEEIKNEVPGAKVERVGEGIVVEFNNAVLFGFDQSALSDKAQSTLDDLIKILNKYPDTDLEIQGHTDNTGTDTYNKGLSERGADAVANYLTTHNISSKRVKTVGFGETAPKYNNDSESGRSQNRRVDFLITANEKMKNDAKKEAGN
jgi:outer membrane protein OmpA-like peptidoglycan-associated protein